MSVVDTSSTSVVKIYPEKWELNSIKTNVKCTEEGCTQTFNTESNLWMHLVKYHKKEGIEKLEDSTIKHFHCPEEPCDYHEKRFFLKLKYLKQHYLKVHADRNFVCDLCRKGFSTLAGKTRHLKLCGVCFKCLECHRSYSSYEALRTHCRRSNHSLANRKSLVMNKVIPAAAPQLCKKIIRILPKPEVPGTDIGIQTDLADFTRAKNKRRLTQHTQTCLRKKPKKTIETQTIGDCILKRAMQGINLDNDDNQKSMETQTKANNDVDIQHLNNELKFNLTLKTCTENETQTKTLKIQNDIPELNDLLTSQTSLNKLNFFESFGNCHSETQTDFIFDESLLEPSEVPPDLDLYSNMYTQTCNEAFLSEFTNIQTQTNWPDYDMFVSTETQTLLTQSVLDMALNGRELSHMETQTDMEFKQLLEEINA